MERGRGLKPTEPHAGGIVTRKDKSVWTHLVDDKHKRKGILSIKDFFTESRIAVVPSHGAIVKRLKWLSRR